MRLADLAERFVQAKRATLRAATVAMYRLSLGQFIHFLTERGVLDAAQLTREYIADYGTALTTYRYRVGRAQEAPERALVSQSLYGRTGHVRAFLRDLEAIQVVQADLSSALPRRWNGRQLPSTTLSETEALALSTAPDGSTPLDLRDRAMLELMYGTGLRVGEVRGLDVQDLDLTAGTVYVRHGKGGRERIVPLGDAAVEAVRAYLRSARPSLTDRPGAVALFVACAQGGNLGHRLTREGITLRVRHAARLAGIRSRVTPHALRHAFATHLVRAGADIRHVQEILGHSRIDVTERYVHLAIRDLLDAHARAHPRGRRKRP